MSILQKLQARIELYRLEQRYIRRSKRKTFTTDARYVDGEYIYASSTPAPPPPSSTAPTQRFSTAAWRPPPPESSAEVAAAPSSAARPSWRATFSSTSSASTSSSASDAEALEKDTSVKRPRSTTSARRKRLTLIPSLQYREHSMI